MGKETVKIFYKDNCPLCPVAKNLRDRLKKRDVNVLDFNVGTADGLAEATFNRVIALPTVLVQDTAEHDIGEWRGNVPDIEEVLQAVKEAA